MSPIWNNEKRKFSCEKFHKKAFNILYESELGLPKYQYKNIFSYKELIAIPNRRKIELAKFYKKIITELRKVKSKKKITSKAVHILAKGIITLP
jgi:hypothetical protein